MVQIVELGSALNAILKVKSFICSAKVLEYDKSRRWSVFDLLCYDMTYDNIKL